MATQNPILDATIARAQALARHIEALRNWQVADQVPGATHSEALILLAVASELEAIARRDSSEMLVRDLAKLRDRVKALENR